MSNQNTLLPCPFCGSSATLRNDSYTALIDGKIKPMNWFIVQCSESMPKGENNYNECGAWQSGPTPEIATQKWNRRLPPTFVSMPVERLMEKSEAKAFNNLTSNDWRVEDWADLKFAMDWVIIQVALRHGILCPSHPCPIHPTLNRP